MPAVALFTASIETAINKALSLDSGSAARLKPLNGKRLTVFLAGTPIALTLVFSDKVDVLAENQSFEDVVAELDGATCCIKTRPDVLPDLRQSSKITSLIQQNRLSVEGELSIAQQVSSVFQNLHIDWEEHASAYIGDVAAHTLFSSIQNVKLRAERFFGNAKAGLGNALTEEKDVAVPSIAVAHFADQVTDLRDDVERFEARLAQLEQKTTSADNL